MGKMAIHVDADTDGKKFEFAFNWEGDDAAIENVMNSMQKLADHAGTSPEALAHSFLRHLPTTGLRTDPGQQEVQMMAILYAVLQMPTNLPDRPGAIYNYAATRTSSPH